MLKAGDKVRCIKPDLHGRLELGNIYVIKNSYKYCNGDFVEVEGQLVGFYADRFKLDDLDNRTKPTLPNDSAERKNYPLHRGLLRYFPAALAGVSHISKVGNDKHNPGEEMHHARGKSSDHGDCVIRHLIDTEDLLAALSRGDTTVTKEAVLNEVSQLAWRALALSQELHEQFGAPLAPGAKKPKV